MSRYRNKRRYDSGRTSVRRSTSLAGLLLILGFMGLRMLFVGDDETPVVEMTESDSSDRTDENWQTAFVFRVVDGDTIWVDIDGIEEKVRLIGVNTPERDEEGFQEATDYTVKMLLDKKVYLEKDISDRDKYGRLLRYIWLQLPEVGSQKDWQDIFFQWDAAGSRTCGNCHLSAGCQISGIF